MRAEERVSGIEQPIAAVAKDDKPSQASIRTCDALPLYKAPPAERRTRRTQRRIQRGVGKQTLSDQTREGGAR